MSDQEPRDHDIVIWNIDAAGGYYRVMTGSPAVELDRLVGPWAKVMDTAKRHAIRTRSDVWSCAGNSYRRVWQFKTTDFV